jgi:hypothetical protein
MKFNIKRSPLDKWFSFFVRFRDNWTCQICGVKDVARANNQPGMLWPGPSIIECMHIVSRANMSTRYFEDNGMAGCKKCHDFYEKNQDKWRRLCMSEFPDSYVKLIARSKQTFESAYKLPLKQVSSYLERHLIERTFLMAFQSGRLWIIEKDLGQKRGRELMERFPSPKNLVTVEPVTE